MTKYQPLADYLKALKSDEWRAYFDEIERILGFRLPTSARKHPAWWANDRVAHPHSIAWLDAGWESGEVALRGEHVLFRRVGPAVAPGRSSKSRRARSVSADGLPQTDQPPTWDDIVEWRGEVVLIWRPLGRIVLGDDDRLSFPAVPSQPGVYRFRIHGKSGERRYVGEAADLQRRFRNYRNPGKTQQTSLRINGVLKEALEEGAEIGVSLANEGLALVCNGKALPFDLTDKATRRLFEHFAQVIEGDEDIQSLNR